MTRTGWLTALGALMTSAGLATAQFPGAIPLPPQEQVSPAAYGPGYDPNAAMYGGFALPDPYCQPEGDPSLEYYGIVQPPYPQYEPFFFLTIDYMHYQVRRSPVPPLLTVSDDPGDRATLSNPTTSLLFGSQPTEFGPFRGVHYSGDLFCGPCLGINLGGYVLERREQGAGVSSDENGVPTIGIPFQDPVTGVENANIFASPGASVGSVAILHTFRAFGEEVSAVLRQGCDECDPTQTKWFLGVRQDHLRETLRLNVSRTFLGDSIFNGRLVPAGTRVDGSDNFDTRNLFFGVQIGFEKEWRHGIFYDHGALLVRFTGKCAAGMVHQNLTITGESTATFLDGTQETVNGESLAQATNIGTITRDLFAFVPETGITVGVEVSDHLEFHAGYNFIWFSGVARPGESIDRLININAAAPAFNVGVQAGVNAPQAIFKSNEFWMQGLTAGARFRW